MAFGEQLGKLFVKVEADTAALKTGLADAEKQVGGFAAGIKKHQKAIGIGMTATSGAIVGAGMLATKSFMQMGDEIAKTARKTGFSTESLSEWKHVAELSGTSLGTLSDGLIKMQRRVLKGGEGLATYKRALERINISYEDIKDLSPEKQFDLITKGIADLEKHSEKVLVATELFGVKTGAELLPMLEMEAEDLAAAKQEARDLGLVFDKEMALAAEKMTDSMTRLEGSINGVKMAIGENLIKVLDPFIEKITEVIKNIIAWMKEHPELTKVIVLVAGAIGALMLVLGPLLLILPGIMAAATAMGIGLLPLIGIAAIVVIAIAALVAIGILLWKNWDTIKAKAKEIWGAISNFFKETFEGIKDFFTNIWEGISGFFKEHWDEMLGIGLAALGPAGWLIGLLTNVGGFRDRFVAIFENLKEKVVEIFEETVNKLKELWGRIEGWFGFAKGKVVSAVAGFSPLAVGVSSPPGLQHGGIVTRPTLAMIGERGPEAVVPLGKGMGITVNINGGIFTSTEEQGRELARMVGKYLQEDHRLGAWSLE